YRAAGPTAPADAVLAPAASGLGTAQVRYEGQPLNRGHCLRGIHPSDAYYLSSLSIAFRRLGDLYWRSFIAAPVDDIWRKNRHCLHLWPSRWFRQVRETLLKPIAISRANIDPMVIDSWNSLFVSLYLVQSPVRELIELCGEPADPTVNAGPEAIP